MTLETLPNFEGSIKAEASDPYLAYVLAKHVGPVQIERGRRMPPNWRPREIKRDEEHIGTLMRVTQADWDNETKRKLIIEKIWADQAHTGFTPEYYAVKDTFMEDALHCFNRHRRPEVCIDWQSDSKRLSHPRRKHPVYLCDFCPVKSTVEFKQNLAAGLYDKQPGEVD